MKFKVTTVILSVLMLSVWLISCADVPSSGPTPPEFNAEFRFVNAAEDLGDVGISVDGTTVATVSFGAEAPHATYPAGSRTVSLNNGDTFPVAMTTDQRGTVLLLPLTGTVREFIKLVERQIFQAATTSDARLRVVHASADAGDIAFTITGPDTLAGTASYRGVTNYVSISAGEYTFTLTTAAGDTLTGALSLANMRQTGVLIGSSANSTLAVVGLTDN